MPYEWHSTGQARRLMLWPYRSLPRKGFVWFIAVTAGLAALPLVAVLGSMVLWALLPFIAGMIAAIWWAVERSYKSGTTHEKLTLSPDMISLIRHDPGGRTRRWQANPYWIRPEIRPGPVESYLVLTGDHVSGREVELGAFLTPAERQSLARELGLALADLRQRAPG
ncbi:MAG: DUF2244 domain-containing protein [Paracoccus sp. (in: a-proteobacteria)]|nr:DUF2244 domain-containing protein [Paracoccus sp. (in: a-proteobacteria)]